MRTPLLPPSEKHLQRDVIRTFPPASVSDRVERRVSQQSQTHQINEKQTRPQITPNQAATNVTKKPSSHKPRLDLTAYKQLVYKSCRNGALYAGILSVWIVPRSCLWCPRVGLWACRGPENAIIRLIYKNYSPDVLVLFFAPHKHRDTTHTATDTLHASVHCTRTHLVNLTLHPGDIA